MARNKFFNVNLRDNSSNNILDDSKNNVSNDTNNSNKDYNDQIYLPDKKDTGDSIDINNPVAKIFFIVLGLFCVLGTAYYVFQWFTTK